MREMLNSMLRDSSRLLNKETAPYLRDCLDHAVRLMEMAELYRENALDLTEIFHPSINYKMNEIIKVLTIISTIFLPLMFITSLYGMNFDPDVSSWNMPELRWPYGYPFALLLMLMSTLSMIWFFRCKKWF